MVLRYGVTYAALTTLSLLTITARDPSTCFNWAGSPPAQGVTPTILLYLLYLGKVSHYDLFRPNGLLYAPKWVLETLCHTITFTYKLFLYLNILMLPFTSYFPFVHPVFLMPTYYGLPTC